MVRTLHCVATDDEVEEEDDDDDDDEVEELVVALGVVVVGLDPVVDGDDDVGDVDEPVVSVVVVSNGATATGPSPTWESARPTICHVSTVATTRAATQAAAMRQEIMGRFSQDRAQ